MREWHPCDLAVGVGVRLSVAGAEIERLEGLVDEAQEEIDRLVRVLAGHQELIAELRGVLADARRVLAEMDKLVALLRADAEKETGHE